VNSRWCGRVLVLESRRVGVLERGRVKSAGVLGYGEFWGRFFEFIVNLFRLEIIYVED